MADSTRKLSAPKKKKRVNALHHAPFPIPIQSIANDYENSGKWYYYKGDLIGSSVIITHPGDMHYLYHMGFFGKGNLSRSGVSYEGITPTVSNHKGHSLRVMKRQRYIKHLNWKKQKESQECGNEVFDEMKEYNSEEEQRYPHGSSWEQGAGCSQNHDYEYGQEGTSNNDGNISDYDVLKNHVDDNAASINKEFRSKWTDTNSKSNMGMDWDVQEADADFWDMGCTQNNSQKKQEQEKSQNNETKPVHHFDKSKSVMDDWNSQEADTEFWSTESTTIQSKPITVKQNEKNEDKANDKNLWSENEIDFLKVDTTKLCNERTQSADKLTSNLGQVEPCRSEENISNDSSVRMQTNSTKSSHMLCKSKQMSSKSDILHGSGTAELHENDQTQKNVNEPIMPMDPLCDPHDQDRDVLLVSDSEDEHSANEKADVTRKRVVKRDPYKMNEHLQLSLSEAFFLSYGLGCFVCHNQNTTVMTLTEMWQTFNRIDKTFLPSYIVYHYFRSKGWVPKSGLKFGVDFILYKEGPPFYHASFSVVVRLVDDVTLKDDPVLSTRSLNWTALSGLNRITENVSKELMMCFVVKPSSLSDEELLSPACISQFKIKEVLIKRWIPSQERENKNEDNL